MIKEHHKALIFDCDGTLADSMPVHWTAWSQTLQKHGLDHLMPFDRFMNWGGVPAKRIFEILAEECGRTLDTAAMAAEKYQTYYALSDQIVAIEPILAIAKEHHGRIPMAVATGSIRAGVTKTLAAIDATHYFDAIVSADDVTHSKPHPETYLRAAELLGVAPESCLAFEDAAPGLESARAAGMEVIDVRDILRR